MRMIQFETPPLSHCEALEATLVEEANCPFKLTIKAHSSERLDIAALADCPITITLAINETQRRFTAYLSNVTVWHHHHQRSHYSFTLRPPLAGLGDDQHYRHFSQLNPIDIIQRVLHEHQLSAQPQLTNPPTAPIPYIVQYQESSLNFIHRLLARYGLNYFSDDHNTIRILDQLIRPDLPHYHFADADQYHPSPPRLLSLVEQCQLTDNRTTQTPHTHTAYPDTDADAITAAAHTQVTQQQAYLGKSTAFELTPGRPFTITDTGETRIITAITHHIVDPSAIPGDRASLNNPQYHNHFTAYPETQRHLAAQTIHTPRIAGVQIAHVVAHPKSISATALGACQLRFPWNPKTTPPQPQSQSYVGPHYGNQFLVRDQQAVLVHFLHGDPDQPIIGKHLYDGDHSPPCSSKHSALSGLKSQPLNAPSEAGSAILFNDQCGAETLTLQTSANLTFKVNGQRQQTIQGSHHTHITDGDMTLTAQDNQLTVHAPCITLCCGKSHLRLTENKIELQADHVLFDSGGEPQPLARVGDDHQCPALEDGVVPHVGGPITTGATTVFINGQPAARVGDLAHCATGTDTIRAGAAHITIEGQAAARVNDPTTHGGTILSGSATVSAG